MIYPAKTGRHVDRPNEGKDSLMAFISDTNQLRTWDPDRHFELKEAGGGSDGSMTFKLETPSGPYYFDTSTAFEDSDAINEKNGKMLSRIIWQIHWHRLTMPGRSAGETLEIVREAMTSYRGVFGIPKNQPVRVEFYPPLDAVDDQ